MDDLEMEEWMAMTDEEQNHALEVASAEYVRWWNRLSTAAQIRVRRSECLEGCATMRRAMKTVGALPILQEMLKQRQVTLLKIRAWRSTGIYPGSG